MEATSNFGYYAALIAPMILGLNFFRRRKDERSMSSNPSRKEFLLSGEATYCARYFS